MRRHGSASLWAQIKKHQRNAKWATQRNPRWQLMHWAWRDAAASSGFSLRVVVAICMHQEDIGPRAAYSMVRNWTIVHGHWPAPYKRPAGKYVRRSRLRKTRVTSNPALPEAADGA